ncbi:CBS domain-containing protein [Nocardioides aestuarii]|uniref:HPP family protein n=1 Tax=Nocardioides aestuarii TaxID=252231 RepID=A0ABW4TTQ2_9ACTN
MLVREVMTHGPVTVRPFTTVKQALRVLAEHRVTVLPVLRGDRVVGVVSEADLVRDLLTPDPRAHAIPPDEAPDRPRVVEDVMSTHVLTTRPETDLAEAVELLTSSSAKCLPVVDHHDRLRGVLSRSDVVRLLARDDDRIEAEVDELLRSSGLPGWLVEVHDGQVALEGPVGGAEVARLLAGTVPGVLEVVTGQDAAGRPAATPPRRPSARPAP